LYRKQYLGVTTEVSDLLSTAISSDDDAQLAQRVLVKEASHKVCYDLSERTLTNTQHTSVQQTQCVYRHQHDCRIATGLVVK
jgi:hypothetical protein